jgi:hypothetical protein
MVHIQARILSASDEELWTTESNKVTIPGRPVALKLVGANLAVVVQFTPYQRPGDQWMLVAQGQLWFETAQRGGLRYETTLQTIPVKLGEQVYYFPLGSNRPGGGDYIEICLELRPYTDETEDTAHKEKPGEDHENETQH